MGKYEADVKDMIREALEHSHFVGLFERAIDRAKEEGAREERTRLIERLKGYEKDSVVAKLLRELIEYENANY